MKKVIFYLENYSLQLSVKKLTPIFGTSRGTKETAADNTQSVNIYVSCIFRVFIIFIFVCIFYTTNMVKTCYYLYLSNEIHFAKPLKMSELCAGRKLKIKTVLYTPRRCLYINLLNMKPRSPTISSVYIYIYSLNAGMTWLFKRKLHAIHINVSPFPLNTSKRATCTREEIHSGFPRGHN